MDGVGASLLYGFSPALDLLEFIPERLRGQQDPVHILQLCGGDLRNVLKTVSFSGRHGPSRPLNFYVYETTYESLARYLILLEVALDTSVPIRERVDIFLEIYGNTQLREKTSAAVTEYSMRLVRLLAHREGRLANIIDFSLLKSKDVDELEAVVRSWGDSVPFDVGNLRDERLRRYYKDRYDVRINVQDWDYNMKLLPMAHHIGDSLTNLLSDDAKIIVETARFMLDVYGKPAKEFTSKALGLAQQAGWRLLEPHEPDGQKHSILLFGKRS
eukprot:tig00000912_g5414.t1